MRGFCERWRSRSVGTEVSTVGTTYDDDDSVVWRLWSRKYSHGVFVCALGGRHEPPREHNAARQGARRAAQQAYGLRSHCKRKFDKHHKRFFKKQEGIVDCLYFDIMQTNVRVGDTVQVLIGEISNGRYVEAFGWGRANHIRYDWPRGCAEISVKVLDTVLMWPAGVRRIDAKENEGRPLRQRS